MNGLYSRLRSLETLMGSNLDATFKGIGLITVLIGALWSVHRYHQDRKNEHDLYIFQHQAALYFDASRAAATLATSNDPKGLEEARARFDQLFWGELVVVEDRRVELAMIAFNNCLNDPKKDCREEMQTQYNKNKDIPAKGSIEKRALDLSACARESLKHQWAIEFGKVPPAGTKCPYD
jgi:hypothetical protein